MELIEMKIENIHPYERNPRKNDGAVSSVAESIKQCGYVAPIIVDENNVILAGHTRLKALKKLGYKKVPVIVKEGLTEEQKRKYRASDQTDCELAWTNFRSVVRQFTLASEKQNRVHPTQKPVRLIAQIFNKFDKESNNKTVLDLFGGSGSTLIACEQLNRVCYMAELDPKYCDVIIKRWETLTGKKAVKVCEGG